MLTPADIGPRQIRYALIADADSARIAVCLDVMKSFRMQAQTASEVSYAAATVGRHGPPALLLVDLSLPQMAGFAIIDALKTTDPAGPAIIAWAPTRGLREFAASHLAGPHVRILGSTAPRGVLAAAITRTLRRETVLKPPVHLSSAPSVERLDATITGLSRRAQQLCGTAGVSVYLRTPGETQFRAWVTWSAEAPIPLAPSWMPDVFHAVLETGQPLVSADLQTGLPPTVRSLAIQDGIGGLAAVPITTAGHGIVGMICVFDVEPLTLMADDLESLSALGRSISLGAPPSAPRQEHASDWGAPGMEWTVDEAVAPESSAVMGLLDRPGAALAIQRELARVRRERQQLSVILFDVNLQPAHSGRRLTPHLLVTASEALSRVIRGSDLAVRWGREELLVVLPGLTLAAARHVAERVRAAMQVGAGGAAVAGGVAELLPEEPFDAVVARASEKVQLAREQGHNRVA